MRRAAVFAIPVALAIALPRCGPQNPPPATTTTTAAPATTSAPPPPSTTSPPTAPTTSLAPTPTTTQAPTTTGPAPTSTAPSTTAPATSLPPASGAFSEDFSDPTAFSARFDHAFGGEWNAGSAWGGNVNGWPADHDMACGDPMATHRTITLTGQAQASDVTFFPCLPGGDPAKGHLMTTVNTEGYITAWFAPKQTFTNVRRVCWDQNITWEGGGRWTIVNFLTAADLGANRTDLAFTSPDFPDEAGASAPRGEAGNGVKVFAGGMQVYNDKRMGGTVSGVTVSDKAARYQHCIRDLENGTVVLSIAQPGGGAVSRTVPGSIPNEAVRIEFADDAYNPDKHFDQSPSPPATNSTGLYTWHWDNITVEV